MRLTNILVWSRLPALFPARLRHVTDETTSHSTRRANNTRQVAGYGEAKLHQPSAAAASKAGLTKL